MTILVLATMVTASFAGEISQLKFGTDKTMVTYNEDNACCIGWDDNRDWNEKFTSLIVTCSESLNLTLKYVSYSDADDFFKYFDNNFHDMLQKCKVMLYHDTYDAEGFYAILVEEVPGVVVEYDLYPRGEQENDL